jgi:hypothetical protein
VDNEPRRRGLAAGTSVLLLLFLLLLIGGIVLWGMIRSPPDAPSPQDTAFPEAVPGGSPPPR